MTTILLTLDTPPRLIPGAAVFRVRDREFYLRGCPKCGARRYEPCVYTRGGQIHRDPGSWDYVWNVPGQPMLRIHNERRR